MPAEAAEAMQGGTFVPGLNNAREAVCHPGGFVQAS